MTSTNTRTKTRTKPKPEPAAESEVQFGVDLSHDNKTFSDPPIMFYLRHPGEVAGTVTSLTLKYTPYIAGDGRRRRSPY